MSKQKKAREFFGIRANDMKGMTCKKTADFARGKTWGKFAPLGQLAKVIGVWKMQVETTAILIIVYVEN